MNGETQWKVDIFKLNAKTDARYSELNREGILLERRFEEVLLDLPEETQDVIWQYLFHCEAMSERLLELAIEQK